MIWKTSSILYIVADVLCFGAGMGVPIFCIMLGFPVGWVLAKRISKGDPSLENTLPRILRVALLTSLLTFGMCVLVWTPTLTWLFDPARDLATFGIPQLLFEPRASFVGWYVLMVILSPAIQFGVTVTMTILTLWSHSRKRSMQ